MHIWHLINSYLQYGGRDVRFEERGEALLADLRAVLDVVLHGSELGQLGVVLRVVLAQHDAPHHLHKSAMKESWKCTAPLRHCLSDSQIKQHTLLRGGLAAMFTTRDAFFWQFMIK